MDEDKQINHTTQNTTEAAAAAAAAEEEKSSLLPPLTPLTVLTCKLSPTHAVALAIARVQYKTLAYNPHQQAAASLPAWTIAWLDSADGWLFKSLRHYQKVSQLPRCAVVSRKASLADTLNTMRKALPHLYQFFPPSFALPKDFQSLRQYVDSLPSPPTLIVKPESATEGRGIFLIEPTDIQQLAALSTNTVVQSYIAQPALIERKKFDLRIYVLVSAVCPWRIYLYLDGLVRFATREYKTPDKTNMGDAFMHLTNYAVNKKNEDFQFNADAARADEGSKWALRAFLDRLSKGNVSATKLMSDIGDLLTKAILPIAPIAQSDYRKFFPSSSLVHSLTAGASCFQLLGCDILLDEQYTPYLLEINRNPSLKCDTPLDASIKSGLVRDLFHLVDPLHAPLTNKQIKEIDKAKKSLMAKGAERQEQADADADTQAAASTAHPMTTLNDYYECLLSAASLSAFHRVESDLKRFLVDQRLAHERRVEPLTQWRCVYPIEGESSALCWYDGDRPVARDERRAADYEAIVAVAAKEIKGEKL